MEVVFCNVCNARFADGKLTILIDGVEEEIDACEVCVNDPTKVRFELET